MQHQPRRSAAVGVDKARHAQFGRKRKDKRRLIVDKAELVGKE
jgi:hypothetical protein